MRLIIVGASAGLGRALAEEAASRSHDLLLVATDARDLNALAADLRLRFGIEARSVCANMQDPVAADDVVQAAGEFGDVDGVFFPVGFALANDDGSLDFASAQKILNTNFVSVLNVVQCFWVPLSRRPQGYVVGFGSVAGIRGRSRNVVYAAAKRALLTYFESLRHLSTGTSITVQFYALGYLDTQQTFGKSLLFPKASPPVLAKHVFQKLDKGGFCTFYPVYWYGIAAMLRLMPWSIYKRLKF